MPFEPNQRKKWSVLVYIAADASDPRLANAAYFDIEQIKSVGSSDQVYVAAQASLPSVPARRYVFSDLSKRPANGTNTSVIELDGKVNAASPDSLRGFVDWATTECPAENILVILWGHGFGLDDWDPFAKTNLNVSDQNGHALAASSPQAGTVANFRERLNYFPASTWSAITDLPGSSSIQPRSAITNTGLSPRSAITNSPGGSDTSKGSVLLNSEIASVLAGCKQSLPAGENLAVVGFDCCDMSLLEVWCQMSTCADRGIGSQYGIPFKGWPYKLFLQRLLGNPGMTADDLCKTIVAAYVELNDRPKGGLALTLSAFNLNQGEALTKAVKQLATELINVSGSSNSRLGIFSARNQCPIYDQDGYIDLAGFCRLLQFNFPGSPIATTCDAVCGALKQYVLCSKFTPTNTRKKISLSTGVSVWIPAWIQYPHAQIQQKQNSMRYLLEGNYSATEFAKQTGWDNFLKTLLQNTRRDQKARS